MSLDILPMENITLQINFKNVLVRIYLPMTYDRLGV